MLVVKRSSCRALFNVLLEPNPDPTLVTDIIRYDYLSKARALVQHVQAWLGPKAVSQER